MIYDYFRVTGAHDTVLDYADLFHIVWEAKGNKEQCVTIHGQLRNMLANSLAVIGLS